MARVLVALLAAATLAACSGEVIENQARISDVEGPAGPQANGTNLLFAATFEPRVWAGDDTIPALGFSRRTDRNGDGAVTAADVRTRGPEATIIYPEHLADFFCESAQGPEARRCALRRSFPEGTYDWQWFFEHVPTGIVLEGPVNARSFTVPPPPPPQPGGGQQGGGGGQQGGGGGQQGGGGGQQPPAQAGPIETREPADREVCVGDFPSEGFGTTGVWVKWHEPGGVTDTNLNGDFQVMVEPASGANCADFEAGSGGPEAGLLDLSIPDATLERAECRVTPRNTNSMYWGLELGKEFRWRVRRDFGGGLFGPWTPYASFTAEDFVRDAPTFTDPLNTNANYPTPGESLVVGVSGAGTVNIAWAPTGCPPFGQHWTLFKNGEVLASSSGDLPAPCLPSSLDPSLCTRQITVTGPGDYVFSLEHYSENGALGTVETTLSFTVDD